jgi:cytosine deaminase
MILDTYAVADCLLDLPPRSWVLKRGRITVVTTYESKICRSCGHAHNTPREHVHA